MGFFENSNQGSMAVRSLRFLWFAISSAPDAPDDVATVFNQLRKCVLRVSLLFSSLGWF
jgi:hypothetical protein